MMKLKPMGSIYKIGIIARVAALFWVAMIFAAPILAQHEPLTLDNCVAMALKSNLRIEIADEKLVELDAAIGEAATSNMPKLSAQANYTRIIPQPSGTQQVPIGVNLSEAPNYGDLFAPIVTQGYDYKMSGNMYNVALNLNQTLYTGGKIENAKKIAEISRTASEWQRKSAIREIRRDVTKAYYNALAANESVVALDSAIALMEVMIKDMRNAVEVGMRGEHELLQAEVQISDQRLARQQAATGAVTAHDYLSTLIGASVNTPITLFKDLNAPVSFESPILATMQTKAQEASTDLKALEEQLNIIETSLHIIEASNLPTVFASAGYSGGQSAGSAAKEKFTWKNNGTLTLGAQWDIYDGGAQSHKKRQALSQKRQVELTMENIRVNLDMAVKTGCASLDDAFTSIETVRKSIAQTKRSYEISYDKFQEGMLLSSEVLNAQNLCLRAEISYYAALSTFYAIQADLDYLINGE